MGNKLLGSPTRALELIFDSPDCGTIPSMSKRWGALGGAVLTIAIAVMIAKAQTDPSSWYRPIITNPHVIPFLLIVSGVLFFMSLRDWTPFKRGFGILAAFLVPPVQAEQKPKSLNDCPPVATILPNQSDLTIFQRVDGRVYLNPDHMRRISGMLFIHNCLSDEIKIEHFKKIRVQTDSQTLKENERQDWDVVIGPRGTKQVDLSIELNEALVRKMEEYPVPYVTFALVGVLAVTVNGKSFSWDTSILYFASIDRLEPPTTVQRTDDTVHDSDPRIILEIEQDAPRGISLSGMVRDHKIFVNNRGKNDAYKVQIEEILLTQGSAQFQPVEVVKPNEQVSVQIDRMGPYGQDVGNLVSHDIELLFENEWNARGDAQDVLSCRVGVTYKDHKEVSFRTDAVLDFNPFNGVSSFRDFTFKRVVL